MKKILAILMSILLICTLIGCSSKGGTSSDDALPGSSSATESKEEETFKAPEKYASIVKITINPIVNLYLDEKNVVLAMEFVNTDAKATYKEVEKEIVGANLDAGVKKLINTAATAGFLEKEKKITVDIVECKNEASKKTLISAAGSIVKKTIEESKLEAEFKVNDASAKTDDDEAKGEISDYEADKIADANSKAETSSTPKEVIKNEVGNNKNDQGDEEVKDMDSNKNGIPDNEENLQKPNNTDATNPLKSLKKGVRYLCVGPTNLPEAEYLFTYITFHVGGEYGFGRGDYSRQNLNGDTEYIIYKGAKYFSCTGLGGGGEYSVSATEVKLRDDEVTFVLNEKSELVVKYTGDPESIFKVGMVFSPVE